MRELIAKIPGCFQHLEGTEGKAARITEGRVWRKEDGSLEVSIATRWPVPTLSWRDCPEDCRVKTFPVASLHEASKFGDLVKYKEGDTI